MYARIQITTSRPRRPDSSDEYHNRQLTYYGPDNQRLGRPQQYHYLRLIWVEQDTNLEYTLRYNTSRRGFWISSSPQKGRCCTTSCRFLVWFISMINNFDLFFFFLKTLNRNNDKIELQSIFGYHTSDESRWKSYGTDILPEHARQSAILDRCVQKGEHIIRRCKYFDFKWFRYLYSFYNSNFKHSRIYRSCLTGSPKHSFTTKTTRPLHDINSKSVQWNGIKFDRLAHNFNHFGVTRLSAQYE